MIESVKGRITTTSDNVDHDEWPCVPLNLHYDLEGNWLPCKEAKFNTLARQGLLLKGRKVEHYPRPNGLD